MISENEIIVVFSFAGMQKITENACHATVDKLHLNKGMCPMTTQTRFFDL